MPAMTLEEIVGGSKTGYSLETFSQEALFGVRMRQTEKGGKDYLNCLVRKKEVQAKPEEVIRQLWLQVLLTDYGYPASRITVEYPITFGRDTSKRAEMVIFDKDRPSVPYIIIEVKQPTARGGKDQLKSYGHATGAPLALWSNGLQTVAWHRKNPNYFVEIPDLPTATQTIDEVAGQPWTMDDLCALRRSASEKGIALAR